MNYSDCLRLLDVGLGRDDLRSEYPRWVNEALHSIQADYNWNCMRHKENVIVPSGSQFAILPADFKELTPARTPVHLRAQDGAMWLPCDVRREEEMLRMRSFLRTSGSGSGPDVFLSIDGDRWFLNISDQSAGDLQFRVSYFRFLPKLEKEEDENDILRSYEEMVKAKIKAVGFAETNDPATEAFERLYELKRLKAQGDDARRWAAGRRIQMGG